MWGLKNCVDIYIHINMNRFLFYPLYDYGFAPSALNLRLNNLTDHSLTSIRVEPLTVDNLHFQLKGKWTISAENETVDNWDQKGCGSYDEIVFITYRIRGYGHGAAGFECIISREMDKVRQRIISVI